MRKAQKQLLFFFAVFLVAYILVHETIHAVINSYYGVRYEVKFFVLNGNPLTDAFVAVVPNQEDLAKLTPEQLYYYQYLQSLNEVIGYSGVFLILLAYLIYARPRRH